MKRMRYRICLVILLAAAVLAAFLLGGSREEKQPSRGSLLVERHREVTL